jgi:hypothetical protein
MKFLVDRSDKEYSREKRHLAILSGLHNYSLEEGNRGTSHAEATTSRAEIASNTNKFFLDTAYNADVISIMGGDSRENTQ